MKTITAQTAKAIRSELKERFPDTKFSVRSETYSMGDSVRVSWTDGETYDTVMSVIKKYQYGHFDGMNDIYEHSNRQDFPQAKYVFANRSYSRDAIYKVADEHNKEWSDDYKVEVVNTDEGAYFKHQYNGDAEHGYRVASDRLRERSFV